MSQRVENRVALLLAGVLMCAAVQVLAVESAKGKPAPGAEKAKAPTKRAAAPACRFPDYKKQAAPDWVCGQAPKGMALSAVGAASKSKGGVQHVKELATANARLKLARALGERIEQRANRYATANGVSLAQGGRVITKTFEQKTQEELVGSKIVESITSRRGTIYVVVGLDEQQLRESVIASVKAGITAEPAPWKPLLTGTTAEQLAIALAAD